MGGDYIKYAAIAAVVAGLYLTGYYHAQTKGELALEEMKMAHAKAIIEAQEQEKANYEKRVQSLVAELNGLRNQYDSRMHELEGFRTRGVDLETCRRERSDLASLAVRGEELLKQASLYLSGGSK